MDDMREEVDTLAVSVQHLQEQFSKLKTLPTGKRGSYVNKLYHEACEHVETLDDMLAEIEDIRNDPESMNSDENFDEKYNSEVNRLEVLQERVQEIQHHLEPDVLEADYLMSVQRKAKNGVVDMNEEDESIYDDDDDDQELSDITDFTEDDDEEVDNMRSHQHKGDSMQMRMVRSMYDYRAQNNEELSFKAGELFSVKDTSNPDWWIVCTMGTGDGNESGYVPRNYIELIHDDPNTPIDSDSKSQSSSSDSIEATSKSTKKQFKKIIANAKIQRASDADVLKAKGAVPAGFRQSTLASEVSLGRCLISQYLMPRFDRTGLAFTDLWLDHKNNQLRPSHPPISRAFILLEARSVPQPGSGIIVESRHVRVTLFNRSRFLANVHTVRGSWSPEFPTSWRFTSRTNLFTNGNDNVCLVRSDSKDLSLGLLFELCITYRRQNGDVSESELSTGWGFLPLYKNDGSPTDNRTHQIKLNGGTPFDVGVNLSGANNRANTGGNKWQQLLRPNRTPRLYVRLTTLSRADRLRCEHLPNTIVTSQTAIPLISIYRNILADATLVEAAQADDYNGRWKPFFYPILSIFPRLMDNPDMLGVMSNIWTQTIKTLKRSQRKNIEFMRAHFQTTLLQKAWPLLHTPDLTKSRWGATLEEQSRFEYIDRFISENYAVGLGKSDEGYAFSPFDINEVRFDVFSATNTTAF